MTYYYNSKLIMKNNWDNIVFFQTVLVRRGKRIPCYEL